MRAGRLGWVMPMSSESAAESALVLGVAWASASAAESASVLEVAWAWESVAELASVLGVALELGSVLGSGSGSVAVSM